jgi:hypothetical protein
LRKLRLEQWSSRWMDLPETHTAMLTDATIQSWLFSMRKDRGNQPKGFDTAKPRSKSAPRTGFSRQGIHQDSASIQSAISATRRWLESNMYPQQEQQHCTRRHLHCTPPCARRQRLAQRRTVTRRNWVTEQWSPRNARSRISFRRHHGFGVLTFLDR